MHTNSFCILVNSDCKFLKNEAMFEVVAQCLILFEIGGTLLEFTQVKLGLPGSCASVKYNFTA